MGDAMTITLRTQLPQELQQKTILDVLALTARKRKPRPEAISVGAACRNRTDDLRITSASLWPTELRRQMPVDRHAGRV